MKKVNHLPPEVIMENQQYYDLTRASTYLDLTSYELEQLCKEGYFHRIKLGRKFYYKVEDLKAYKKRRKVKPIKVSVGNLTNMRGKVSRIEDRIQMIERVLDLYYEPLSLDNMQLYSLYKSAKEKEVDNKYKSLQNWGEILIRLNEQHFIKLAEFSNDKACWRPFLELSYVLYGVARAQEMFSLRKLLSKAYRNIRLTTFIYLELIGAKKSDYVMTHKKYRREISALKKKNEIKNQDKKKLVDEVEKEEI